MSFNIFGTKIYISFLFCATLSIMLLQDKSMVALPLFCAVAVHELAHITVMFLLDVSPKEINFSPYGIEIVGEKRISINQELKIAVAGPMVNIVTALVLFVYYKVYLNQSELIWCLIWAFIGIFNLLPSYYLDGGTILFNVCLKRMPAYKSEKILKIASIFTSIVLVGIGVYFVFVNFNPSIIILGLYLFVLTIFKN